MQLLSTPSSWLRWLRSQHATRLGYGPSSGLPHRTTAFLATVATVSASIRVPRRPAVSTDANGPGLGNVLGRLLTTTGDALYSRRLVTVDFSSGLVRNLRVESSGHERTPLARSRHLDTPLRCWSTGTALGKSRQSSSACGTSRLGSEAHFIERLAFVEATLPLAAMIT